MEKPTARRFLAARRLDLIGMKFQFADEAARWCGKAALPTPAEVGVPEVREAP